MRLASQSSFRAQGLVGPSVTILLRNSRRPETSCRPRWGVVAVQAGPSIHGCLTCVFVRVVCGYVCQALATPRDAMDRLDLEMMLSCLGPSPRLRGKYGPAAASSRAAAVGGSGGFSALVGRPKSPPPPLSNAEQAGLRAISVATATLFLDSTYVTLPLPAVHHDCVCVASPTNPVVACWQWIDSEP